jgi:hypothetical protein
MSFPAEIRETPNLVDIFLNYILAVFHGLGLPLPSNGRILIVCTPITVGSWCVFGAWPNMVGLVVGVILLDLGVQGALISNQHLIYGLGDATRSRINTVFMGGMFVGGSLGSAGATIAWHRGGWWGTCVAGIAFAVVALLILQTPGPPPRAATMRRGLFRCGDTLLIQSLTDCAARIPWLSPPRRKEVV